MATRADIVKTGGIAPNTPGLYASTRSATRRRKISIFIALIVLVLLATAASLALGSRLVAPDVVWHALTHNDASVTTQVIRGLRVPRTAGALIVGASLGLAGVVMQTLTRNPLADPGILGINAGAGLAVVGVVCISGASGHLRNFIAALLGALLAAIGVHTLSGTGGRAASPARLALAGVAVSAALSSLTQALILGNQVAFNEFRYWVAGSLEGRSAAVVSAGAIFMAIGVLLALVLAPALGALALGDEAATGLGVRVRTVRTLALLAVALLCGGATAVAGPITFVGLAVPLVSRALMGEDLRWNCAAALLLGAVWVVIGDVIARLIVIPDEVPVGVVLAVIGAPFFIVLVRRRKGMA